MLLAAVVGSLIFWLPTLVLRAVLGENWQLIAFIPIMVGLPILVGLGVQIFSDKSGIARPLTGILFLLGIWVSGPLWIALGNSFSSGEGFHQSGALREVLFQVLIFPVGTPMAAGYQGTAVALVLATLMVIVIGLTRIRFVPVAAVATGSSYPTLTKMARTVMLGLVGLFFITVVLVVVMWRDMVKHGYKWPG